MFHRLRTKIDLLMLSLHYLSVPQKCLQERKRAGEQIHLSPACHLEQTKASATNVVICEISSQRPNACDVRRDTAQKVLQCKEWDASDLATLVLSIFSLFAIGILFYISPAAFPSAEGWASQGSPFRIYHYIAVGLLKTTTFPHSAQDIFFIIMSLIYLLFE